LRRIGRRDITQVEVKVKSKIKAKVKGNFEIFENSILENKVKAQVKIEVKGNFKFFGLIRFIAFVALIASLSHGLISSRRL
jgi:hypothetical protein